ncbi:hypothetical protein VNO78_23113 [Psophocarpus tetragonolobus]|uniref:Uncharacterized protein n=1 Tax=Psophocarpus tetragonolobus TaxID=3891 RepID=A0AAN9S600_PSOTE
MADAVSKVSGELKSSSFDRVRPAAAAAAAAAPRDSSLVLASRPARQAVSYWTCSKLCAICFVAGMLFGYSLRGRVKRWASKMLKKLT